MIKVFKYIKKLKLYFYINLIVKSDYRSHLGSKQRPRASTARDAPCASQAVQSHKFFHAWQIPQMPQSPAEIAACIGELLEREYEKFPTLPLGHRYNCQGCSSCDELADVLADAFHRLTGGTKESAIYALYDWPEECADVWREALALCPRECQIEPDMPSSSTPSSSDDEDDNDRVNERLKVAMRQFIVDDSEQHPATDAQHVLYPCEDFCLDCHPIRCMIEWELHERTGKSKTRVSKFLKGPGTREWVTLLAVCWARNASSSTPSSSTPSSSDDEVDIYRVNEQLKDALRQFIVYDGDQLPAIDAQHVLHSCKDDCSVCHSIRCMIVPVLHERTRIPMTRVCKYLEGAGVRGWQTLLAVCRARNAA